MDIACGVCLSRKGGGGGVSPVSMFTVVHVDLSIFSLGAQVLSLCGSPAGGPLFFALRTRCYRCAS